MTMPLNSKTFKAIIILLIITAGSFLPSLFNNFVDGWDDDEYVLDNKIITRISFDTVKAIFTQPFAAAYCPLAVLTYAIEYHFFQLNPFAYHFTNYILNILTVLLVFTFLRLLTGELSVAFLASLLFAVHPLHVESVAWISERKDMLCAFFYVASLVFYLMYRKKGHLVYYVFCFAAALLALLAKGMAITIPFVLLLIDYFSDRRVNKESVAEKIPIFAIAAIAAVVNFSAQLFTGAMAVGGDIKFRIYFLSKAIPFYLGKVLLPVNLSAIYPYHNLSMRDFGETYLNIGITAVLLVAVIFSIRHSKKAAFGSAFFIITLLPVLKIVPIGDTFAADRYMYLPSIGLFYMASVVINSVLSKDGLSQGIKRAVTVLVSAYIVMLAVMTWSRCLVWHDIKSLFLDVAKQHSDVPLVNNRLGVYYAEKGETAKARRYFKKAFYQKTHADIRKIAEKNLATTSIDPKGRAAPKQAGVSDGDIREAAIFNKLAGERLRRGNIDDAIGLLEEAVAINPRYAEAYNNLGYAYYLRRDLKRSAEYLKAAVSIDPSYTKARQNLDAVTSEMK